MATKPFRTYAQQAALLESRGMDLGDRQTAMKTLRDTNYYRLSGYWYPFRLPASSGRQDRFAAGTRLDDVHALHDFDFMLRNAAFAGLSRIEVLLRARLAHQLGAIDPLIHLKPAMLGPLARAQVKSRPGETNHDLWRGRYQKAVAESREEFVLHHLSQHGGVLPVWAATEVLDWGSLSWLYSFAPVPVQAAIAQDFQLSAPQLGSWLRSLNVVRNVCAHQGRLYNKVFAIKPKMPARGRIVALDEVRDRVESIGPGVPSGPGYAEHWFGERTFGQLTLIQYLLHEVDAPERWLAPAILVEFPRVPAMTIGALGAPDDWAEVALWSRPQRQDVR